MQHVWQVWLLSLFLASAAPPPLTWASSKGTGLRSRTLNTDKVMGAISSMVVTLSSLECVCGGG